MASHRVGWALTVLVTLFLIADGLANLLFPGALEADMAATGWPLWTERVIGLISLVSGLLFAVPQTAVIGAILTTGFLGGAIATHFRIGEIGSPPELISLALGLLAWTGLWLRGLMPDKPHGLAA